MFNERATMALALLIILILAIMTRLVYLQIISHEHFSTLADDNRITITAVAPTRGLIYDRNGVLLAENLPSYSLDITPERSKDIDATIAGLSKIISISASDIARFKKILKRKRSFISIPLRFRLNDEEVARIAANRHHFPSADVAARLIRSYPNGALAVHTLGYVGRINEDELQTLDSTNYSATRFTGKTGIEKFYEDTLHGKVGYNHVETNALGRTLRTIKRIPPIPGENIYLTIDARLQHIAEQAIGNRRGAIVAIDPENGDILAFVSMPGYDPNLFVTGIDVKSYDKLRNSPDKPLFNRALQGQYPPGSTMKPFIGLAGLELEHNTTLTSSFCPGWFMLKGDDHKYRDWKKEGHGKTSLDKAIVESCDVYFYNLARILGIDRMHDFLSQFGFGKSTGIDLIGEPAGLLPSSDWKRKKYQLPWYPGETLISGIGQGYTLTTPLQLANTTAIIAAKGKRMQPRLVFAQQATPDSEISLLPAQEINSVTLEKPSHWDKIIHSMTRVVHSSHGTARAISQRLPFKIAGKTGTAQVFGIKQDEEYNKETVAARLRDHSLFIAFAPAEKPKIALAIIVENGGSGSAVAAPISREIIEQYLIDESS